MDEQRQASTCQANQSTEKRASIQPPPPLPDLPESGDLHATLPLSQVEARQGTHRAIRLPGGRQTTVVVPAGVSEGQVISLEGLGEPAFPEGPRGRLTLTLTITPGQALAAKAVPPTEKRTAQPFPRPAQRKAPLGTGLLLLLALALIGSLHWLALRQQAARPAAPVVQSADTPLVTRTAPATAPTATATAVPGPAYPPAKAILALNDPLQESSSPSTAGLGNGCWLAADGYHVSSSVPLWTYFCTVSATPFSTMAYEVHMRMVKGNAGGLILRANVTSGTFYYFRLDQAGHYQLLVYAGSTPAGLLVQGNSSSFQTGPGQSNLLAVVATGDEMRLYVNHTFTAQVRDGTYSQGQIGVAATADARPVEVVFSQARVWEL
jgi:hypothetical protein